MKCPVCRSISSCCIWISSRLSQLLCLYPQSHSPRCLLQNFHKCLHPATTCPTLVQKHGSQETFLAQAPGEQWSRDWAPCWSRVSSSYNSRVREVKEQCGVWVTSLSSHVTSVLQNTGVKKSVGTVRKNICCILNFVAVHRKFQTT